MTASPATQAPLNLDLPGDVAALITNTYGYFPTDSIVIIGLKDGTTGGFLRVDLIPAMMNPSVLLTDYGRPLVASAEHISIHFITPDNPDPRASQLYQMVYNVLAEGFTRAGLGTVSSFQIGPDYARPLACTDPHCCAYPGTDISPSPQAAQIGPGTITTPAEAFTRFTGTQTSEHFAAEVEDYAAEITSYEGLDALTALADGEDHQPTAAHVAAVLANLTSTHTPALLALTFGDDVDHALDYGTLPSTHTPTGPAWDRVERITAALAATVPHTTTAQASYLHTAMAFIRHAQGRNSLAEVHRTHAETIDPDNTLTTDLPMEEISGWAQRKETAYTPR